MIGIIEEWLFNHLGMIIDLRNLAHDNPFRDGYILMEIFQKYGLLNSSFSQNIISTNDKTKCINNLGLLKPLFEMLKIKYNDETIQNIVENKTTSVQKLLYELYVCLENKQHLYFISQLSYEKVQSDLLKKLNLEISTADALSDNTMVGLHLCKTCYEQPLINNDEIIQWYKNKYLLVRKHLSKRINELKKDDCLVNTVPTNKNSSGLSRGHSYDSDEDKILPDLDSFLKYSGDGENLLSYEQFVTAFKIKQHMKVAKKYFEKSIQSNLLEQTWNKVAERQSQTYNLVFSEIMLKQSEYEKQMLTKFIQTQQQIKSQNKLQIQVEEKVMKKQEEEIMCDIQLQEQFKELQQEYEKEQGRVMDLHRKLYKEKQEAAKKRHYLLCYDIVDSIIDTAMNVNEYKLRYGTSVPTLLWNNWMQLFSKSQQIRFPFEDLETEIDRNSIDYDEIIEYERVNDDILNENDVDEYLFTCGRWYFEEFCLEQANIDESSLAFIVHRLLSIKYPPPSSPLPADLPNFKVAGVLLNCHNKDFIEKLKILFTKPSIHVFDVETAIKQCIATFQKETSSSVEEKGKGKSKSSKKGSIKSKKKESKDKGHKRKGDKNFLSKNDSKKTKKEKAPPIDTNEETLINLINKETQTSFIQDVETKPERTSFGLLGEKAFGILKNGDKIEDELSVFIIIEYLKTLTDINGWVLLNYPFNLEQAYIIELALTGKKLPKDDYLLEENDTKKDFDQDENSCKQKSRLFLYPPICNETSNFKSYFTTVITLSEKTFLNSNVENEDNKVDSNLEEAGKENQSDTNIKEKTLLDKSVPNVLETFYTDQSIFKYFYCDSFDVPSSKLLARVFLGEDGVMATNSTELFGEESLSKLIKGKKKDKKEKSNKKSSLTKKKEKQKNPPKGKTKKELSNESPETKEKTVLVDRESLDIKAESNHNMDFEGVPADKAIKASVANNEIPRNWQFLSLPINDEFGLLLATMWEAIESSYINNLKDMFFENRTISLRLFPYSTYVQKEVYSVLNKPDMKQNLVDIFQDYYNSFDNELRILPEVKGQFNCKIIELQQSLWEIVDNKKQETETKRQQLINENWLVHELCLLINNYLSFVQIEFDRTLGTLKLVSDYYLSMLGKSPSNIQPTEIMVAKIDEESILPESVEMINEPKIKKKSFELSGGIKSEMNIKSFIAHSLIDCQEENTMVQRIHLLLLQEITKIKAHTNRVSQSFNSQIKIETDLFNSVQEKLTKERTKINKPSLPKTNRKKSNPKTYCATEKIDEEHKKEETTQLLLNEWKFVLDIEISRFNFRLNLIKKRSEEDITEFYCYVESVFCELYNNIISRYKTEISNIDKLCGFVKIAIEEESQILQPIVLNHDQFYIRKTQDFVKEISQLSDLTEETHQCHFTISQLYKLLDIFKISGPYGIIRKQPFCYIIQDLISFNARDNQPHFPKMWNLLNEYQLRTVVDSMFGVECSISWRDFIIYNLNLPYPSIDDIISLRNEYLSYDTEDLEVISREIYEKVPLWFEKELPNTPQEGLRLALVKDLLFRMFQVDILNINYSALLLNFCKDFDPAQGLRKALCLSLGKNVIISKDELDEILINEAEIIENIESILIDIINSIVFYKEGVLIYEIGDMVSLKSDQSTIGYSVQSTETETSNDKLHTSHTNTLKESLQDNSDFKSAFSDKFNKSVDLFQTGKTWISKVPISTVISVLDASLLSLDQKTFSLRPDYDSFLEEEADSDGFIKAHLLVSLSCIKNIFRLSNKFKIIMPCDILEECLNL